MTKTTYAHTMQPLILGNAMESNEDMVMIPRLNALVRQTDLCIAILEAIQKMGYDRPSATSLEGTRLADLRKQPVFM